MLLKSHCLREDQVQRSGRIQGNLTKRCFDHSGHEMKTNLNNLANLLERYPNLGAY